MMTTASQSPRCRQRRERDERLVDAPAPSSQLDELRREVDPDDAAAGGAQDLGGELADQPQPDHRDALAEADVGLTHAVQRDAADRGEGRLREVDPLGNRHAEVRRDVVDLGVDGVVAAAARNAIAGLKVADARSPTATTIPAAE